jgi:hypothetical protein
MQGVSCQADGAGGEGTIIRGVFCRNINQRQLRAHAKSAVIRSVMKNEEEQARSIALMTAYCWLLVFTAGRITKRRRYPGRSGKREYARNAVKYSRPRTIQRIAQANVGERFVRDNAKQNALCIIAENAEGDSLGEKGQRIHSSIAQGNAQARARLARQSALVIGRRGIIARGQRYTACLVNV